MAVSYTPGGGQGPLRFENSVESIPAWHQRLRNVALLCRDGFGLIEKIDDTPKTALYLDPPYLLATRGKGGGSLYQHDFEECSGGPSLFGDVDDHERLAELLGRFQQARVVVSYYDHPRLETLYPPPRWTIRKVYRQKNLHVQNRRGMGKLEAPEVLILNGDSYQEPE